LLQYFAEEKAAQRSCKRTGTKAGETIQLKPFTVDTKVYKKYMKRILESAYEKMWWHRKGAMYDIDENGIRVKGTTHKCPEAGTKLWVQHDGARPHTSKEAEKEWKALTTKYSKHELGALILEIFAQSAQSPDTNCLDKCEWPPSRPSACHTSLSPPLPSRLLPLAGHRRQVRTPGGVLVLRGVRRSRAASWRRVLELHPSPLPSSSAPRLGTR